MNMSLAVVFGSKNKSCAQEKAAVLGIPRDRARPRNRASIHIETRYLRAAQTRCYSLYHLYIV